MYHYLAILLLLATSFNAFASSAINFNIGKFRSANPGETVNLMLPGPTTQGVFAYCKIQCTLSGEDDARLLLKTGHSAEAHFAQYYINDQPINTGLDYALRKGTNTVEMRKINFKRPDFFDYQLVNTGLKGKFTVEECHAIPTTTDIRDACR